ncbi:hypothetical protein [Spongiimicrobium salis]|uniref:hypothetical protein n=1 Tax=Spongiimicrobium salis TaxID=1667022 RepID=UPI00374DA0EA
MKKVFKINSSEGPGTLVLFSVEEVKENIVVLLEEMDNEEHLTLSIGTVSDGQIANLREFDGF